MSSWRCGPHTRSWDCLLHFTCFSPLLIWDERSHFWNFSPFLHFLTIKGFCSSLQQLCWKRNVFSLPVWLAGPADLVDLLCSVCSFPHCSLRKTMYHFCTTFFVPIFRSLSIYRFNFQLLPMGFASVSPPDLATVPIFRSSSVYRFSFQLLPSFGYAIVSPPDLATVPIFRSLAIYRFDFQLLTDGFR